jgi:anti-anti-sigma factor
VSALAAVHGRDLRPAGGRDVDATPGPRAPAGARLLELDGEVDFSNAHEILDALVANVPGEASLVVLDLGRTSHLDSSGVAMLFRLGDRLRRRRQDLRLAVPVDSVVRALVEMTAVASVIPVADTVEAAVRA